MLRRRLLPSGAAVLCLGITLVPRASAAPRPTTTTSTVPQLLDLLPRLLTAPTSTAPQTVTSLAPDPGTAPASRFFPQEGSPEDVRLLRLKEEAEAGRRDVEQRIAGTQATLARLRSDLEATRTRLAAIHADERTLVAGMTDVRHAAERARGDLARRAVAAYTGEPAGGVAYLNAILTLPRARDRATADAYLQASFGSMAEALRQYGARHVELERLRRAVTDNQQAALSEQEKLKQREKGLDAAQRQMSVLSQQLANQAAKEEALRGLVFASRDEFERRMAVLAQESGALTAQLRAGSDMPPLVSSVSPVRGSLSPPLVGAPTTSRFGPRVHPVFGDIRQHTGVDLGAAEGTRIAAAADGRVVVAGAAAGYGNLTIIQHAGDVATVYAHQSSILVGRDQEVRAGEVIGLVGCTGYCTGPHLHFEVRVNGTPVDPEGWW